MGDTRYYVHHSDESRDESEIGWVGDTVGLVLLHVLIIILLGRARAASSGGAGSDWSLDTEQGSGVAVFLLVALNLDGPAPGVPNIFWRRSPDSLTAIRWRSCRTSIRRWR